MDTNKHQTHVKKKLRRRLHTLKQYVLNEGWEILKTDINKQQMS